MAARFVAFCITRDAATGALKLADLGEYATFAAANNALIMQRYKPAAGVLSYDASGAALLDASLTVRDAATVPFGAEELKARVAAAAPAGRPWPSRILLL